ncbi:MAG: FtsH protease activity modulator HflK [Gammaproteobacteria bacterium]|nr:FtsH protease activity modulator HflK [Gammaproteobacteria bacterium]HJL96458.1 FtsH protease activity modulator HflK [SAR86 cluster bacterium]
MSWNGNDKKDPWGRNDAPPEIDEVINKAKERINSIFGGGSSNGSSRSGFSKKNFSYFFVILFLFWVGIGVYQVEQAERSVVLRLGSFQEIKGPGLRWNPPIIDKWEIVDVVRVRPHRHDALMLTKDENIVDVTVSVQYQIADPKKYVLDIRDADASLAQATESALRHVVGSSIMDDALTTGRELIAQEVRTRLQRYLDKYSTGLEVLIVNIEDSSPPNQVQEAFDDVIKAREDEVRARNEAETYANGLVPEARGEAQRMLQDAEAYREQVISEAQGDAARFNLLLTEYQKAPEVTRNRLYLDSIQGVMSNSTKVMIDVEGGNNILYLPLDKIAQSARNLEDLDIPSSETSSTTSIRELTNQVIEEIRRRNRQEERR